jgi:hypothetical protein
MPRMVSWRRSHEAVDGVLTLRICPQSWSPHNLYNLIARSMPFYAGETSFKKTGMTMYQQRWRSKRLLRGYHGDWIREKIFKRWYLPIDLPRLENNLKVNRGREASGEEKMPVASLFLRDVERRLDTVVFRCCFARSAREARSLVLQGKVKVNGTQVRRKFSEVSVYVKCLPSLLYFFRSSYQVLYSTQMCLLIRIRFPCLAAICKSKPR